MRNDDFPETCSTFFARKFCKISQVPNNFFAYTPIAFCASVSASGLIYINIYIATSGVTEPREAPRTIFKWGLIFFRKNLASRGEGGGVENQKIFEPYSFNKNLKKFSAI